MKIGVAVIIVLAGILLSTEAQAAYFYYNAPDGFTYVDTPLDISGAVRGNIYYDRENTGFYLDPASTSFLNDIRPSIVYDRDNTGFYLDPASTSRLNIINTDNIYFPGGAIQFARNSADDGSYEWAGWYSGASRAGIFLWDGVWNGCDAGKFCIFGDTHQLMLRSLTGNLLLDDTVEVTGDIALTGTLTGGSVPWARLTSFPAACPAGQAVQAVGGTLTCVTVGSGTITGVTAGSGLTGGGTSGDVTLDVGAGNGISVAADSVSINSPACGAGQVSKWTGTAWTCVADLATGPAGGDLTGTYPNPQIATSAKSGYARSLATNGKVVEFGPSQGFIGRQSTSGLVLPVMTVLPGKISDTNDAWLPSGTVVEMLTRWQYWERGSPGTTAQIVDGGVGIVMYGSTAPDASDVRARWNRESDGATQDTYLFDWTEGNIDFFEFTATLRGNSAVNDGITRVIDITIKRNGTIIFDQTGIRAASVFTKAGDSYINSALGLGLGVSSQSPPVWRVTLP